MKRTQWHFWIAQKRAKGGHLLPEEHAAMEEARAEEVLRRLRLRRPRSGRARRGSAHV